MKVRNRKGIIVDFDWLRIRSAIAKAFAEVYSVEDGQSSPYKDAIDAITQQCVANLQTHEVVDIETIQKTVEKALIDSDYFDVGRAYIVYEQQRTKVRQVRDQLLAFRLDDGRTIAETGLFECLRVACTALDLRKAADDILSETVKGLFAGCTEQQLRFGLALTTKTRIERDYRYGYVAARLLLDELYSGVAALFDIDKQEGPAATHSLYRHAFVEFIFEGVRRERLSPRLDDFDVMGLAEYLRPERDFNFDYLGLRTVADRYLVRFDDVIAELPQVMLMRVAMGMALNEEDCNRRAKEFYDVLSQFEYLSSTPTLFNSGTAHSQLSSCYVLTVPDDLDLIYKSIWKNAMLSKWSGGLGNDWTPVRSLGARIKGTNGKSQGVVPFLKVANDTAVAVNQGGKRAGALCSYLETWHLDIEEFLELRKNTGDDRRRTHDMNTANWIPDLFMERVFQDGMWTLFSPNDVPDLHSAYGRDFRERYERYERLTKTGEIKLFKRIRAVDLWRKMLSMLFETGHPWIVFKDPFNIRNPQAHAGTIHSSNLCTEIALNTSAIEVAVCNLGSINLVRHLDPETLEIDYAKLERTVTLAVRMLDNVIEVNFYPVDDARHSNLQHRPIGLGIMGFQDVLYAKRIPYASQEAVELADKLQEFVSFYAIKASAELARERYPYPSFPGSTWSQGLLPLDTYKRLAEERDIKPDLNLRHTLDWESLRDMVRAGMRNSNITSIAPTACVTSDTRIHTATGVFSYREILEANCVDWHTIEKSYNKGWLPLKEFLVISQDLKLRKCDKIWYNGHTEVYEVTFHDGAKYRCSAAHKLYRREMATDTITETEVSKLAIGDRVIGYTHRGMVKFWIVDIQKIGKLPTWDIEVEDTHNYLFANGVLSHNTISNIAGVTQSIEPTYQNLYVKTNLSGDFTVVNEYLVRDLMALGLWTDQVIAALKSSDGSVLNIPEIPEDIKALYATAFEIESKWLVMAGARRQKWLDQAQSLNLYMAQPSGKKLDELYRLAWLVGLKSTYYLRTLGATQVEKSTVANKALNSVEIGGAAQADTRPKVCSLDDPTCESCQ
jgi:ribonucleoside-diphosphate reductase alpha chain